MAKKGTDDKYIDNIIKPMLKLGELAKKMKDNPDNQQYFAKQLKLAAELERANAAHAEFIKEEK